jgi:hypothetical protein
VHNGAAIAHHMHDVPHIRARKFRMRHLIPERVSLAGLRQVTITRHHADVLAFFPDKRDPLIVEQPAQ